MGRTDGSYFIFHINIDMHRFWGGGGGDGIIYTRGMIKSTEFYFMKIGVNRNQYHNKDIRVKLDRKIPIFY